MKKISDKKNESTIMKQTKTKRTTMRKQRTIKITMAKKAANKNMKNIMTKKRTKQKMTKNI